MNDSELIGLVNNLYEENEQLKKELNFHKKMHYELKDQTSFIMLAENRDLKEENELFKITLQEAIEHERTSMGKSVLKQLADRLGVEY